MVLGVNEAILRKDLHFGKSLLPDFPAHSKFLLCPIRKMSFHELRGLFNAHFRAQGEQHVNMVAHDHKTVHFEFLRSHIERSTSMNKVAMRSVCNRARPPSVLEGKKKVRTGFRAESN